MHTFTRLMLGLLASCLLSNADAAIQKTSYRGWAEAFTLTNDLVAVVVVPSIARIMQMRFLDAAEGPFWENRLLEGRPVDSKSSEWINLGGEKTWPAPQSDWAKITGRGWPPPMAFDATPLHARADRDTLVLTSPVDPNYGIEVERRLTLSGSELKVSTTYHKREGKPVRVSVWTVAQLKDPERVYMPAPKRSLFLKGYNEQSSQLPAELRIVNGVASCARATNFASKIGSDASRLIWVGPNEILETIAPREEWGDFPDQQSSAEIYTNPDPLPYVELEMLGPLHDLEAGESISREVVYRLHKRASNPAERKAQLEALLQ
jgi:hypothetical protein